MKIAVFCSSSTDVSPMFLDEIERLGEALAEKGHTIVYGGCNTGCMGALARGVQRKKGELIGVIPQMDFALGIVQPGLSQEKVVPTLSSRKEVLISLADAFLVYPGGIGTLDEVFEVLALKSLGIVKKPLVFYDFLNTWSPFLEYMETLVQIRMIRHRLDELLTVENQFERVVEAFS